MYFLNNIRQAYAQDEATLDDGGLVDWLIVTAGMALVTAVVMKIVAPKFIDRGERLGKCVSDSSAINTTQKAEEICR